MAVGGEGRVKVARERAKKGREKGEGALGSIR